jgi:hypothetical protein
MSNPLLDDPATSWTGPEVHQAIAPWNGKCAWCGEDELEGGSDGGRCGYCGDITIPPAGGQ